MARGTASARTLLILCMAYALAPAVPLQAQGRERFVQSLETFSNALAGTHGDEGPVLVAAIDAMEAGLRQWNTMVANVEAGLAAEIGAAPPAAAARMRTALGTVYLERGRLEDALAQFDAAVTLDPQFADVHLLRGLTYERLGRREPMAAAHRSLWQLSPGRPAHAYLFLRSGPDDWRGTFAGAPEPSTDAGAAMATLLSAVEEAQPSGAGPLFVQPGVLEPDQAVAAPVFAPAAYAGAVALLLAGQYDAAVLRLRAIVSSDPLVTDTALQDDDVRHGLAGLKRGDASALARLREMASRHLSGELHRVLGLVYADARQYDSSLEQLRRAVRINPRDERARLALADVFVASGDPAGARDALLEIIRAMPESGLAHWKLGRLHQLMGDETGALQAFEAAAAVPALAGASHVHAAIGRLYHNQLDLDAAGAAYARRAALTPNDSAAHYDLGEVLRAQNRLDAAMAEYLVAALLDPASARVLATIGQMHAAGGRDEPALRMLRRAIELDETHLEARYALSRALLRLGRTTEAQRELAVFEQLQAKAMEEERRRFRDNQMKIDEALKANAPAEPRR